MCFLVIVVLVAVKMIVGEIAEIWKQEQRNWVVSGTRGKNKYFFNNIFKLKFPLIPLIEY